MHCIFFRNDFRPRCLRQVFNQVRNHICAYFVQKLVTGGSPILQELFLNPAERIVLLLLITGSNRFFCTDFTDCSFLEEEMEQAISIIFTCWMLVCSIHSIL